MEDIWHKLSYAFSEDIEDLVGIESRVKKLKSYLAIEFNNIRILGVWGMGELVKQLLLELFSVWFLRSLKEVVFSPMLGKNLKKMV